MMIVRDSIIRTSFESAGSLLLGQGRCKFNFPINGASSSTTVDQLIWSKKYFCSSFQKWWSNSKHSSNPSFQEEQPRIFRVSKDFKFWATLDECNLWSSSAIRFGRPASFVSESIKNVVCKTRKTSEGSFQTSRHPALISQGIIHTSRIPHTIVLGIFIEWFNMLEMCINPEEMESSASVFLSKSRETKTHKETVTGIPSHFISKQSKCELYYCHAIWHPCCKEPEDISGNATFRSQNRQWDRAQ